MVSKEFSWWKLSVMSRKTFWLWGSVSFFSTSGNKAVSLNLKAPAKEQLGVTRQLVLVAFEKFVKQKLCQPLIFEWYFLTLGN